MNFLYLEVLEPFNQELTDASYCQIQILMSFTKIVQHKGKFLNIFMLNDRSTSSNISWYYGGVNVVPSRRPLIQDQSYNINFDMWSIKHI